MYDKLKKALSDYSGYVVAAFGLLLGAFLIEKHEKESSDAKLETAEYDKKDAKLEQQQADIDKQIQQTEKDAQAAKDKALSDKEIQEFLNNV